MNELYRYEIVYRNDDGDTQVILRVYPIIRQTSKCYFIKDPRSYHFQEQQKRILKSAMNTYAFDTKEKAKEHFIRRTKTRIKWFNFWIEECQKAVNIINNLY